MFTLLAILHVLVALILIGAVLLQSGGKSDIAAAFGGSATQTAFGGRGPVSFLHKVTTAAAIIFMCTSLILSVYYTRRSGPSTVFDKAQPVQTQPAEPAQQPPAQSQPARPQGQSQQQPQK